MKDNVSIMFVTIISVLLLVILPLISVLERQDNMSYNLVMKLTTSFADEVRSKGYIDTESYSKFVQGLSATGNSFDIQMEAHRKIIIKDEIATDGTQSYKEDTLIDYNTDIFEDLKLGDEIYNSTPNAADMINNKSDSYLLDKGDEFYIKVKNTNITAASVIYGYIAGNTKETIININYGGVVNKQSWNKYSSKPENINEELEVIIGLPKNTQGITPINPFAVDTLDPDVTPYYYFFNLVNPTDQTLKFKINVKNYVDPLPEITSANFENYIELLGFTASTKQITKDLTGYEITLSGLSINQSSSTCQIIVKENLTSGYYGSSLKAVGKEFVIYDSYNIHSVTMTGPYSNITGAIIEANASGKISILAGSDIYFLINYNGITSNPNISGMIGYHTFTNTNASVVTGQLYIPEEKRATARINVKADIGSDLTRLDNFVFVQEGATSTLSGVSNRVESKKFDIIKETIWNFPYKASNDAYDFTVPFTGTYLLEVWGARGSSDTYAIYGGQGGYASGRLMLNAGETLYIYAGGTGSENGFNGGGSGRLDYHKGGGATDIRLGTDSLYARIIVAGGGGRIWGHI